MSQKYSGKQVIKAGEMLISHESTTDEKRFEWAMDVLSYWRYSHEAPLAAAFEILQNSTREIDNSAIFAKRLKRFSSIVNKLIRFREMKLKNMQDIGGCRTIVGNTKKLEKVVRALRKRPEFKDNDGRIRYKDYVRYPKEDGYRGYHLIGQFPDGMGNTKSIEIQIRTKLQHDWATALEIVDLFTGQALKSNRGDYKWRNFFKHVSEQFSIMEGIHLFEKNQESLGAIEYQKRVLNDPANLQSCKMAQIYSNQLKVVLIFEALTHSLRIVDDRLQETSVKGYVLVEVNTTNRTVQTTLFEEKESKEAEKMYTESEKKAAELDGVVVALVSTTAVGGIREAYPNYFADSTEFLKHLIHITSVPVHDPSNLISLIIKSLNKSNLK